MVLPTGIEEFVWLDERIHATTERYKKQFGIEPVNVSHWDPSDEVRRLLSSAVHTPPADVVSYFYSYLLEPEDFLRRLGFSPKTDRFCLLTPGGTASMLSVAHLLRLTKVRLHILCPFYFPLRYQCEAFGVPATYTYLDRNSGVFKIPAVINSISQGDAIWITNPTYCTGCYFSKDDIGRLEHFLRAGGIVIADESLSLRGYELSRPLGHYPGFIGIYSPHKAISLNSMKFSAIITHSRYEILLESWADVLYGSLPASSVAALKHFTSSNYALYEQRFLQVADDASAFIRSIAGKHCNLALDLEPKGQYLTCYLPRLHADLGNNADFLWKVACETGAVFIAGTRNHFNPIWGLNFRINMMLDGQKFRSAFTRLANFLTAL